MLLAAAFIATSASSALAVEGQDGLQGDASRSVGAVRHQDVEPFLAAGLSLGAPIALAAVGQPLIGNVGISYPLATLGAGTGHLLAGDPTRALAVSVGGAALVASSILVGAAWDELTISKSELRPRKWTGIILVTASWPIYSAWAAWDAYWTTRLKMQNSGVGGLPE